MPTYVCVINRNLNTVSTPNGEIEHLTSGLLDNPINKKVSGE
jgi:hypothetical protein